MRRAARHNLILVSLPTVMQYWSVALTACYMPATHRDTGGKISQDFMPVLTEMTESTSDQLPRGSPVAELAKTIFIEPPFIH
jgi:hypothetical protein